MTTERQDTADTGGTPAAGVAPAGGIYEGGERVTRPVTGAMPRRPRPARPPRPTHSREQLAALIDALGDSAHPQHATAVDELVAIGPAAVPALSEALDPGRPWLTIYRAAEAAGRIGDGRATSPLIQALNHPNSNVRWSAVRALTQIGDVRSLIELRRVAQHDQGRTSWGEPVAGAAQSALGEIGRRSVWGQSLELIKTAVTAVLMIFALILAFSVVSTLRDELDSFGQFIPGQTRIPQFELPTALPEAGPTAEAGTDSAAASDAATNAVPTARPTVEASFAPTGAAIGSTGTLTGTVRQDANVRPFPSTSNQPIGRVNTGDTVIFLARSADDQWFLVRLGEERAASSAINTDDGTGWVSQALVSAPAGELPVQDPDATPAPTASP